MSAVQTCITTNNESRYANSAHLLATSVAVTAASSAKAALTGELGLGVARFALLTALTGLGGGGLEGGGHDVLGEAQICAKVLYAFVGQVVVVMLPVVSLSAESLRSERLHQAEDLQVGDLDLIRVDLLPEVLLGNKGSLLEEVGVDRNAVGLSDEHVEREGLGGIVSRRVGRKTKVFFRKRRQVNMNNRLQID